MSSQDKHRSRAPSVRFFADLLVTVAVLVAAGLVIASNWPWRGRGVVIPDEPIVVEGLATRGSKNAKVVLVEYADFQCPSCAGFFRTALPRFERQYVEPGLVRVVFRHLPLPQHESAWPAASATECAGRHGRFWEMHDLAFRNQRALTVPNFLSWASQLGIDASVFEACLDADDVRGRIEADLDSAEAMAIASTPTLIVGRVQPDGSVKLVETVPSAPFSELQAAVDRALSGSGGSATTGVLVGYAAASGFAAVVGAWHG